MTLSTGQLLTPTWRLKAGKWKMATNGGIERLRESQDL